MISSGLIKTIFSEVLTIPDRKDPSILKEYNVPTKYINAGKINVARNETSKEYTVSVLNMGDSPLKIYGVDYKFWAGSWLFYWSYPITDENGNPKNLGFNITPLVNVSQGAPLTIPPSGYKRSDSKIDPTQMNYQWDEVLKTAAVPIAKISFHGKELDPDQIPETYSTLGLHVTLISSDPSGEDQDTDLYLSRFLDPTLSYAPNVRSNYNNVIFEVAPRASTRWNSKSNIIYQKNIHGHINTPPISDKKTWGNYVKKRINDTINPMADDAIERITIADFLKLNDFINNRVFDDEAPEVKRVFNRFEDPLPPYDFIWPYGDYYAFNGLRRTIDYLKGSRIDEYYYHGKSWFGKIRPGAEWTHDTDDKSLKLKSWEIEKTLAITDEVKSQLNNPNLIVGNSRQRREWGFREKVLKGFPYYFPKYISPNNKTETTTFGGRPRSKFTPCGQGPVLVGIVTAGSGIFGGIPSSAGISYNLHETQRSLNGPTDSMTTKPKVPTGLIFIQDETGAIGLSFGSDMRYMENPTFHGANFAESSIIADKMHLGSAGIPKSDFRQFLREGDLVVIQTGVGLRYWHPVLGAEPKAWESLIGEEEIRRISRPVAPPLVLPPVRLNIQTDLSESIANTIIGGNFEIFESPFGVTCEIIDIASKYYNEKVGIWNENAEKENVEIKERNRLKLKDYFAQLDAEEERISKLNNEKKSGLNQGSKDIVIIPKEIPEPILEDEIPLQIPIACDSLPDGEIANTRGVERRVSIVNVSEYVINQFPNRVEGGTNDEEPYKTVYRDNWAYMKSKKPKPGEPGYDPIDFNMNPDFNEIITSLKDAYQITFVFRKYPVFVEGEGTITRCECSIYREENPDYGKPVHPYIDNWGAHTRRVSNNSFELAFEHPLDELGIPIFGGYGYAHELFDAAVLNDESISNYANQWISMVSGAFEGAREGAKAGWEFVWEQTGGDPISSAIGAVVGLILGLVIALASVYYVYNHGFYRERYVLRSRAMRDGQYPFTGFYPIQEYHAWSTGTPIPIDNGMPFIMSDTFMIDPSERFRVPPLQITAAELRGIPQDTWRWDPNLEWQFPKKHLESVTEKTYGKEVHVSLVEGPMLSYEEKDVLLPVEEWNSPYHPTIKNLSKEFPGIEDEPVTPYTLNPGSQYKGQLVTIKNVRFIEVPKYEYLVVKISTEEQLKIVEDDKKQVQADLQKWLDDGKNIREFRIKLNGVPNIDNRIAEIENRVDNTVAAILPVLSLAMTILKQFFSHLKEDETFQFLESTIDEFDKYAQIVQQFSARVKDMINTGVSGFSNYQQIEEFLAIKHGIDYNGLQMDVDYGQELYQLAHREFGNLSIRGMVVKAGLGALTQILDQVGLKSLGKIIENVNEMVDGLSIPEVPETNENMVGSVRRNFKYEKVMGNAVFPMSVDKKNGGYWWADPSIPLPNARSHQNDANWGNPNDPSDNEGDFITPNTDIAGTERYVFTQLVSSNKKDHYIPIYDADNPDFGFLEGSVLASGNQYKDVFGEKFNNKISYIEPRYVRDLGRRYLENYEPFAEHWKPYRFITQDKTPNKAGIHSPENIKLHRNVFNPIKPGKRFVGNTTYFVVDENNVVIPVRINANTEIAKYFYEIPTGRINLTGIAWQYSMGTPGLEWQREGYMMQIWPRYLSDVGLTYKEPPIRFDYPELDESEKDRDVPVVRPPAGPEEPKGPRKLPDLTLDIGDAGNPARLDCESVRFMLDSQNQYKEQMKKRSEWPVDREYESDPRMNVHKDPETGREVIMPKNIKEIVSNMPDYPCKGMKIGEQRNVTITSEQFPGVSRTFFFMVGPNGECLCTAYQPGTEVTETNTTRTDDTSDGYYGGSQQTSRRFIG